jgi:hypothetical protein
MSYVNCARYPHEQNLVAIQTTSRRTGGNADGHLPPSVDVDFGRRPTGAVTTPSGRTTPMNLTWDASSDCSAEIYYETCRDVTYGVELLVWYGDCYDQFMGIPVALKTDAERHATKTMATRTSPELRDGGESPSSGIRQPSSPVSSPFQTAAASLPSSASLPKHQPWVTAGGDELATDCQRSEGTRVVREFC